MDTLTIKSRVGPTKLRCGEPLSLSRTPEFVAEFNFDNDFRAVVPAEWWEKVRDLYFDRSQDMRYRDAFKPL